MTLKITVTQAPANIKNILTVTFYIYITITSHICGPQAKMAWKLQM